MDDDFIPYPSPAAKPSAALGLPIDQDLISFPIIRTETVLSRLPIHNLSKTGSVSIRIARKNEQGEVDLLWKVVPSRDYGEPRQLAYKLDSIVINRRIDELGRPLPEMIRLGSLREICRDLGLRISGRTAEKIKKALLQNAFTGITAKLSYRGVDGEERRLEAGFTRYAVIFTGQKLPNGRSADGVYIEFHPRYREVLNHAPVRPLNYEYLKELPPAAQRFYEIVSYRVFAALHYGRPEAKLLYSEYCTFSAQRRHEELWQVKRQMTPIHRRHTRSGYLSSVRYVEIIDNQGQADWEMLYTPGARARAEYATFMRRSSPAVQGQQPASAGISAVESTAPVASLVGELTRRGIAEPRARKLLENLLPDQPVADQIEWGDFLITQNPAGFRNPAGFYISLIRDNVIPPEKFETSRRRREFEERERARQQWLFEEQQLQLDYERYREEQKDLYIRRQFTAEHYQKLLQAKKQHFRRQYPLLPDQTLDDMAHGAVRGELEPKVTLLSFDEWRKLRAKDAPENPKPGSTA